MLIKFICDNQMKTNKSFLVHNLLNSSWTVNNKTNTKNCHSIWIWFIIGLDFWKSIELVSTQ